MKKNKKSRPLCPSCGLEMRCINTQLRQGQTCRYRLCDKCGAKFATIEKELGKEVLMYEVNKEKLIKFI